MTILDNMCETYCMGELSYSDRAKLERNFASVRQNMQGVYVTEIRFPFARAIRDALADTAAEISDFRNHQLGDLQKLPPGLEGTHIKKARYVLNCQSRYGSGSLGVETLWYVHVPEEEVTAMFIIRAGRFLKNWDGFRSAVGSDRAYEHLLTEMHCFLDR